MPLSLIPGFAVEALMTDSVLSTAAGGFAGVPVRMEPGLAWPVLVGWNLIGLGLICIRIAVSNIFRRLPSGKK